MLFLRNRTAFSDAQNIRSTKKFSVLFGSKWDFCKFIQNEFCMESIKNVGLWIRVSTDFQVKDESPEHHEKRGRNYAEAKGWNVVTVYRCDVGEINIGIS